MIFYRVVCVLIYVCRMNTIQLLFIVSAIQSTKLVTLVYTPGNPGSAHLYPKDTTPTK